MHKTFLIADEDIHWAGLICEELNERYGGDITIITLRNGQQAYEYFRENLANIHLVLSDVRLAEIDGIDFLKMCKKFKPEIPFIICSGYSYDFRDEAWPYDAYIVKGSDLSELFYAIDKLLNNEQVRDYFEYKYKGYFLDEKFGLVSTKGIAAKYSLIEVLGIGGFGIALHVRDFAYRHYALKTLREEYSESPRVIERFKKEAKIWMSLGRHPYIVQAKFVEELAGRIFIKMEYVSPVEKGLNTLENYLRTAPPSLEQSLHWAIQFCYGMEHAYLKGIKAHRDIKPSNILIDHNKEVKIVDFGLAGIVEEMKNMSTINVKLQDSAVGLSYQTIEGTGFGTPPYMPPEQFYDAIDCDERSDIYSFGIVLFQMASGGSYPFQLPITGKDNKEDCKKYWREMHRLHSQSPVPKLKNPLSRIILRCLEKKRSNRYSSFTDVRNDLETWLWGLTGKFLEQPQINQIQETDIYDKAISLYNLGKYEEALEVFNQITDATPSFSMAWYNKAKIADLLGQKQEAINLYRYFYEIGPANHLTELEYSLQRIKELE